MKNTKFSILTLAVLLAGFLMISCDSLLDVDPQQSIDESDALSTPGNVQAALVGAYSQHRTGSQYGGRYMMLPDLLADAGDIAWTGTFFQPREVFDKVISADNSYTQSVWVGSYNTINRVNNVLSALDILDEQDRVRVEAESRFLRAAAHFELVRVFAKAYNDGNPTQNPGVPIVLTPTRGIDESSFLPRATVEEVYQAVIADLTFAKNNLPEANGVFANTFVASAFLARVHFMRGEYAQAATEATRVIGSGRYSLMPTFAGAFNNDGNVAETVYGMVVTPQDGTNELNLFYASSDFNGRGDIDILDQHLARYEAGDARADFFYTGGGARRSAKWQTFTNIPVIRLAELYLTRAESNLRAGTATGDSPASDLNAIRTRAGLAPLAAADVTVDAVLAERRVELAFEGHLLHDLKRTGRSIGDIPFNAAQLVYPIPQREMEVNPNLVQNPGYGN
ncbi:MAG: RagB/SusD family nutrient uptake outer membrane protein [Candidatus Cyclonatronum sp.]|uniref:RagB/SusD family nutrient uptake outer membrane protein n=1 Tax=Cyclonatronum sp. TaxID=3024185 RepID=UPI0025BFB9B0|nr:RagB/SusD family nutrient uptake outer membrane protein [Cyclonatronum sp.]MCC5933885.1 RagB/SusD family nutrient uptake outer membrane protein [Balneolales bacterium]MCH8487241.1 RagB/SusD family nutrient uptake outer membrane protein [Cyclonatronum sp.]